jgi:UPF0271 protein
MNPQIDPKVSPRPRMDLNADAGEGCEEQELFRWISSASVACGGHAGDRATMRATLHLARSCGVAVGAHPGYEDRERFGRAEVGLAAGAVRLLVERQLASLAEVAALAGVPLAHVKPHGALYHRLSADAESARQVAAAVAGFDSGLAVISSPGSALLAAAGALGLRGYTEGFVDRRYRADGGLLSRGAPDALLGQSAALDQALALSQRRSLKTGVSPGLRLEVQTLCLHADSPGAAAMARAVRQGLETAGFEVRPCAPADRVRAVAEVAVVAAAILDGSRVLLARRGPAMSLAGRWEMPGGKVRSGETPRQALVREIFEELGLSIEVREPLGHGSALVAGQRVVLEAFLARLLGGEAGRRIELREHAEAGWFSAAELGGLDWSEADQPIVPRLAAALNLAAQASPAGGAT